MAIAEIHRSLVQIRLEGLYFFLFFIFISFSWLSVTPTSNNPRLSSGEDLRLSRGRPGFAWAWMRRLIMNQNLALPTVSDFELLHSLSGLDEGTYDLVWLISNYVEFVGKQKTSKATYFIDVDILKLYLSDVFQQNRKSQNKVRSNLLT